MTNKITLIVPDNITYLSNWKELDNLLVGDHIIVNKKITGCGATSYFLNHPSMKVILCSPRKLLLRDKLKQNPKYLHWFRKDDDLDEDLLQDIDLLEKPDNNVSKKLNLSEYKEQLRNYISRNYVTDIRKILVTYDSLKYVLEYLKEFGENLDEYTIVVDEFHSIFQDSRFKPDVELSFLNELQRVKKVIYLSATPILKKYLDNLDEFKNLPYYELEWPENKLIKANINRIHTDSLINEAIRIINSYRLKMFPSKEINGQIYYSTEAVLFLNSVSDIIKIIKKTKLTQDECNILCSNNKSNKSRLKKIKFEIGDLPEKSESNKMFTFCTRTSFLGADFYSTCASTYIFADPNIDSLGIDISMDLPQIIGRQRLKENPFRYDITLFYKTSNDLKDYEKFQTRIENKKRITDIGLKDFSSTTQKDFWIKKLLDSVKVSKYNDDYIGFINENGNLTPKFNHLVYFSELRAWEIQQINFKDGYSLLKSIQDEGYQVLNGKFENEYDKFYTEFNKTKTFSTRMKLYCDFCSKFKDNSVLKSIGFIPYKFHEAYDEIGEDKLRSLKYIESSIDQILKATRSMSKEVYDHLKSTLKIGDRRSLTDLKQILGDIYKSLDIKLTPKAIDISKYFTIKKVKMSDRKTDGYEILSYQLQSDLKDSITVFDKYYNTDNPNFIKLGDVLTMIKTGKGIKEVIEEIRKQSNHDKVNELKLFNLPLVCWNGTFSNRKGSCLLEYSSYIAIDIDNVQTSISELKKIISLVPFVKSVFTTPSGKGLKIIIQHNNTNPKDHKKLFDQIVRTLGFDNIDLSVSDLARGNFLTYDPDIYINPNPETFNYVPYENYEFNKKLVIQKQIMNDSLEDNKIIGCLDSYWEKNYPESYKEGNRHNSVLKQASKLNKSGINKDQTLYYLLAKFDLPELEIQNIVNYVYTENINEFGIDRNSFKI